jgi:hypothetical protein
MASYDEAVDVLQLVFFMALMTLNLTHRTCCHPYYNILFPSTTSVHRLFMNSSSVFADGLFEVLRSEIPLTIEWFRPLALGSPKNGWYMSSLWRS